MREGSRIARFGVATAGGALLLLAAACVAPPERSSGSPGRNDAQADASDPSFDTAGLDDFIAERMATAHLPGLSVAVIKDGKTAFLRAYGFANLETMTKATPDTLFGIASISKAVTATALMQLFEQGRFGLDDDVGTYLPFAVRNPGFANDKITFRMILAHTSSINGGDGADPLLDPLVAEDGDTRTPLGDVLKGYLVAGGRYYDANNNFINKRPGTTYSYSNLAIALAGYLVEVISGVPFDAYVKKNILGPLGMVHSSFRLADLDLPSVAVPYESQNGKSTATPHLGLPDYPADTFHTSAREFARFITAHLLDGELDGVRILKKETAEEMRRTQFPSAKAGQGLVWYAFDPGLPGFLGHDGTLPGISTYASFDVATGVGIILFGNGDWTDTEGTANEPIFQIAGRLAAEAARW
jgi:CubicO group peptidase (beta-lactamase class C family)